MVVITAGPARAQQVLREALAKGADRAIHLEDNAFVGLDALSTARAFAAAIKDEQFDLIFTGLQSDDYGFAQTGVILAELLGWPHATIIMQIEKTDAGIKVKRELEAGYFQFVDMPLPAVLTIQSGINKLRYATLIGIKQAKNKPLRKLAMAEVQQAVGTNMQKLERLYVPQKSKKTEYLEGAPGEIAKKLVDKFETKFVCCKKQRADRRNMSGKQIIRMEEVQLGGDETKGTVLMTVGKLLLWTDLIFLAFVYCSIKSGSLVYPLWFVIQGAVALTLLIVGRIKRGPLTD